MFTSIATASPLDQMTRPLSEVGFNLHARLSASLLSSADLRFDLMSNMSDQSGSDGTMSCLFEEELLFIPADPGS